MTTIEYILGLGSNLGSRHAHLMAGLALLRARVPHTGLRVSPCYESDPIGPPQPRYLNAAVRLQSELAPNQLLAELHAIERSLGRKREQELRWGPRVLDLDILWASQPCAGPAMIPHPRLHERWFALRPLLDLAPDLELRYAPALRALAPQPLRVQSAACAEVRTGGGSVEIACHAADLAEALATSLTALGRTLFPDADAAAQPVQTLSGEISPGAEAAGCIDAVLTRISHGTTFVSVTIAELGAGRFSARLLPARPRHPHASPPLLTVATLATHTDTGAFVVRLQC